MKPALLLLLLGGCSLVSTRSPSVSASGELRCTRSKMAPLVDSALTVVGVATAIGLGVAAAGDDSKGLAIGAVGAGVAGLGFGVSAVIGWKNVGLCRAAHRARDEIKRRVP